MAKKLPRCKVRRCNRIARTLGYCKTHALREADKRFSEKIRSSGKCIGQTKYWTGPTFPCAGAIQCCHLFSRRYRNIRWHERNAVPGCAAHHLWMDTHPLEKDDMMLDILEHEYQELHDEALDMSIDWHERLEEVLSGD